MVYRKGGEASVRIRALALTWAVLLMSIVLLQQPWLRALLVVVGVCVIVHLLTLGKVHIRGRGGSASVHQHKASENMKEGDAPWGVCLIILQNGISSFPCCSARISAKAVYMAANPQTTPTTPPAISRLSMAP